MFTAFVQIRAVDYGALEVKVRTNPAEYRELLSRFIDADTTLTADQLADVYYGFAFTPSYEPTDSFPDIHEAYRARDYQKVAELVEPALQLNPVSLDLSILALTAYENGASATPGENARRMAIRIEQLVNTIIDSGKGTSASSPFFVISDSDRIRLLNNVIGIGQIVGTSAVGDNIVAFRFFFPGTSRLNILYFDETPELRFNR